MTEDVAGCEAKSLGLDSSLLGFVLRCIVCSYGGFGKVADSIGHCYKCRSDAGRLCSWSDRLSVDAGLVFQIDAERAHSPCPMNWTNGRNAGLFCWMCVGEAEDGVEEAQRVIRDSIFDVRHVVVQIQASCSHLYWNVAGWGGHYDWDQLQVRNYCVGRSLMRVEGPGLVLETDRVDYRDRGGGLASDR